MPTKNKILLSFGMMILMLGVAAGIFSYALLSDVEVNIAQNPNASDSLEAGRKLKLFGEAVAAKKQGFIRLSEAEINAFLHNRYKSQKNRTNSPVQLVKAGVLLHQTDLTFITWQKLSLFGMEIPVVWQRLVSPQRTSDGWRLSLDEMRIGKITIPGDYWADVSRFLGGSDSAFEERKVWIANVPTVMLSHNEITRAPELRLYTYIPVIKSESDPAASENLNTSAAGSTNVLTAQLAP